MSASGGRGKACGRLESRWRCSESAALAQTAIFLASGSVALLADLIHNFGDAATAIPIGVAFLLRSERAERYAGLFVVAAIFISACVAGVEAVSRLIHPQTPTHLVALAGAGADRLCRQRARRSDPNPCRTNPRQRGPDRRWQPRPRRCVRQLGRDRKRRRGGPRAPNRRSTDRPRDHRRDPQDHLGLLAHGSRPPHPLARHNPATLPPEVAHPARADSAALDLHPLLEVRPARLGWTGSADRDDQA